MLKKIITLCILFCIPVLLFTGWKSGSSITNFYYYKDQPFYLKLKNDQIYIKLKKGLNTEELRSLLLRVNITTQVSNINSKDDRQFISLGSPKGDAELMDLSARLKQNSEVEYASPVYSPDEGKTQIGVENEIMVQFKPMTSENEINSYVQSKGMVIKQKIDLTGGPSYILTVNQNDFAMDVANEVYRSGKVNWAEPNLLFTNLLCFTPNDPNYGQQWAIKNTGNNIPDGVTGTVDCDMDVDSAWDLSQSNNKVIIAINDTGCDTLHEDLASKFIPGTGYNFFSNLPGGFDDMGHGTSCAGIVGAVTNNNIGIAGVAPNARLLPVKWMNSSGSGTTAGATNAIIYCYQKGAWVISNSWGFQGGSSSAMDQAINDCTTLGRGGKGTLFVVAAGNENSSAMRYPANTHPKVLVVGGISPCNQRKNTSSCDLENFWGASYGTNLHVVAPCVKIYATDITGSGGFTGTNYDPTFNGTSSATPNVAGVCGLVFGVDSMQTWDTVRARIDRTCEKRGSYTYTAGGPVSAGTWNQEMGYGLVNAYAAVKAALISYPLNAYNLQSPAAGTIVTTLPGSSTVTTFGWDTASLNASYKWVFGTSLPARQITQGVSGNAYAPTLGQLDAILAGLGVVPGGQLVGSWDVWAFRPITNDSLKATNGPRTVTLKRGVPTLSGFSLLSPASNTTIITSVFNSGTVSFNWNKSGSGNTYKWKFGSPTLSTLKLVQPSNNSGFDSTYSVVNSTLDQMLGNLGLAPGDSLVGQWAVWAYNGNDSLKSTQTFNLTLKRQAKGDVIIVYDSTSTGCITSRDSIRNNLSNSLGVTYDMFNRGTQSGTTSISFRGYKKVIVLGEGTSAFSTVVKDSLKAYMNAGGTSAATKSKVIIFSEDVGYQYGRSGSTYYDLAFVNNYLGFDYMADAPAGTSGAYGFKGDAINTGIYDSTSGPWPDVLKKTTTGGIHHVLHRFRKFQNNPDSANAIGSRYTTFNVAVFGVDVESIRSTSTSPSSSPVYRFIKGAMDYVDELTVGVENNQSAIPTVYELSQNYPNPFNPATKISFSIPKQGLVTMQIFDVTGREVALLVNDIKAPGYYDVIFDGAKFASGVYFYRIQSNDFVQTKKMLLIK